MWQTWILIIISILFVMGTTINFCTMWYTILMLWICKKSIFSLIFPIINVHLWNESKLDAHNNLHFICYGLYSNVLLIVVHDINALDLQEKLFVLPFSLELMFIYEIRQTWILIITSIFFVMGTTIMFSLLGYTILKLWICRERFSFHHFPYNQISLVKWGKHGNL